MDVKKNTFRALLPSILSAISTAHFVSFDLELSGIPSKQRKASSTGHDGNQTLQKRYQELKQAAERYHILQLGMTCVEEDNERGSSIASFDVNPY